MNPPSDKCKQCNWWTLLGEIRDEISDEILSKRHNGETQRYLEKVMGLYNRARYKVVMEHWSGKR